MAMMAYLEAVESRTDVERKAEVDRKVRAYWALDTDALMRIWAKFSSSVLGK